MSIIKVGIANPVEVNTASLPEASVEALLRRGLSHLFGNEVSSKLVAETKKHKAAHMAIEGATEDTYVALTDDEVETLRKQVSESFMSALLEGTLGTRSREPAVVVDPLEVEMHRIAREQIKVILAKQSGPDGKALKLPKAGESVTFANGETRQLEDMITRRIELDGEAIEKQAKATLRAKAQRKANAEKAAAGAMEAGELGL